MDFKHLEQNNIEIENFLRDVREYLKASLETSEYENSSNLFYITEAKTTVKLMERCEILLQKFEKNCDLRGQRSISVQSNLQNSSNVSKNVTEVTLPAGASEIDGAYLDMTGNCTKKRSISHEHISSGSEFPYRGSNSLADICQNTSDSCAKCRKIKQDIEDSLKAYAHETLNKVEDSIPLEDIYDTCIVSQYTLEPVELIASFDDCPYRNLPAAYLEKNKSIKYGPLQRIEKRLFFDQCKRCFCGILNDWLLCYADASALHPNNFLYLKNPDIRIEHFGEGKRRDLCFQLTSGDPVVEKLVFQAINEIDAKEWIHAIEAVKSDFKKQRRLPTPPVIKKITFIAHVDEPQTASATVPPDRSVSVLDQNDRIYEEPLLIYDLPSQKNTSLQQAQNNAENKEALSYSSDENLQIEFYDTPKTPPKPVEIARSADCKAETMPKTENDTANSSPDECTISAKLAELYSTSQKERTASPTHLDVLLKAEGTNSDNNSQKTRQSLLELAEKIDIQAKVKDFQSKLSSQLFSPMFPPNIQDHSQKKAFRKTYTNCSNDAAESMALTTTKQQLTTNKDSALNQNGNNNNNKKQESISSSDRTPKVWFLSRFQKTTSSLRGEHTTTPVLAKCLQGEKQNLLNAPDSSEQTASHELTENKSKINMIINRLEASGGHKAMLSVEVMGNLPHNLSENNDCNTYEPMITTSLTSNKFLKKLETKSIKS